MLHIKCDSSEVTSLGKAFSSRLEEKERNRTGVEGVSGTGGLSAEASDKEGEDGRTYKDTSCFHTGLWADL